MTITICHYCNGTGHRSDIRLGDGWRGPAPKCPWCYGMGEWESDEQRMERLAIEFPEMRAAERARRERAVLQAAELWADGDEDDGQRLIDAIVHLRALDGKGYQ